MKKLTAMLLALCMLLAAVSALGEDFSGTWYMSMADVSLGSFVLNEDGTAEISMAGQDPSTGTWAVDGDTVSITIGGEPAEFTYDGSGLVSDKIPIPLSREEGKLSMDLITKMMNGEEYELPEGMTEIELMTIAMNFLAEYAKITESGKSTGSGESTETGDGQTEAPAPQEEPDITLLAESFKVIESYNGFRAVYIAKIQNDTSVPLYVSDGSMKVFDAAGETTGEATYLYTCGSKYLEPGEISFVSMQADVTGEDYASWEKTIEVKTKSYYSADKALTLKDPKFELDLAYGNSTMRATVVNDTGDVLKGLNVIFVLEDAEGNLLDLTSESIYRHELGVDSSITMISSVNSRVMDFCQKNGIEPSVVEALAWVDVD